MLINNTHLTELKSPNQTIKARVELYNGSTLEKICNCSDTLSEFTVEKTGESKFFGFGICQKLRAVLLDVGRELELTPNHTIEAAFGVNGNFVYPFPNFYISEIERDEENNTLTITAYDALYRANNLTVSEINIAAPYTLKTFIIECAAALKVPVVIDDSVAESFQIVFKDGANFDGTETIRSALNAAAELTQTIYYIDNNWNLVFKRLDKNGAPVLTVQKNDYLHLTNEGACVLNGLVHTTELEDSVKTDGKEAEHGITQFIRNNPFWELRTDIGAQLDSALARIGGISIHQVECEWIGNYLLEIGDKIAFIAEDDSMLISYALDDTITFDGTLLQSTRWAYDENSSETADNPSSLGEALNKTYARVDKVNKRIDLVVSDAKKNKQSLSQLVIDTAGISAKVSEIETEAENNTTKLSQLTTNASSIEARVTAVEATAKQNTKTISQLNVNADSISAQVSAVETTVKDSINSVNETVNTLAKTVEAKMDATQVSLAIKTELENGVEKVTTTTGYTFDENGLTVSKSGSEMETTISEDGMTVYKDNAAVLVANNAGVEAKDLHAITYLKVGGRSRFENYESNRTGCFWIGGLS